MHEGAELKYKKTAQAILGAAFDKWTSMRQMGHTGCAIEHYVWDRAGLTALARMTRQWHLEQPCPPLPAQIPEELARLTEFVLVTAVSLA